MATSWNQRPSLNWELQVALAPKIDCSRTRYVGGPVSIFATGGTQGESKTAKAFRDRASGFLFSIILLSSSAIFCFVLICSFLILSSLPSSYPPPLKKTNQTTHSYPVSIAQGRGPSRVALRLLRLRRRTGPAGSCAPLQGIGEAPGGLTGAMYQGLMYLARTPDTLEIGRFDLSPHFYSKPKLARLVH